MVLWHSLTRQTARWWTSQSTIWLQMWSGTQPVDTWSPRCLGGATRLGSLLSLPDLYGVKIPSREWGLKGSWVFFFFNRWTTHFGFGRSKGASSRRTTRIGFASCYGGHVLQVFSARSRSRWIISGSFREVLGQLCLGLFFFLSLNAFTNALSHKSLSRRIWRDTRRFLSRRIVWVSPRHQR